MHTLYTAGYTGSSPDQIKKLAAALNAKIVDIRISPRSRVPEWSGANLQKLLQSAYIPLRALGNKNYQGEFGPTSQIILVDAAGGIEQLASLLKRQNVIILCACKDYRKCHRLTVADLMQSQYGVEVKHLSLADIGEIAANGGFRHVSLNGR